MGDRYGPPFTTTLGLAVTGNEQIKRKATIYWYASGKLERIVFIGFISEPAVATVKGESYVCDGATVRRRDES